MDYNGICRDCKLVKFLLTFGGSTWHPLPSTSDCVFFNFGHEELKWDGFTYNLLNYTRPLLFDSFPYKKGVVHNPDDKRPLYEQYYEAGKMNVDMKIFVNKTLAVLRETTTTVPPKSCYRFIMNNDEKQGYDLLAREGYYLDLIEKDPTEQAKSQIGVYGKETLLNSYYCKKDCPEGVFYDFDSVSCRRCAFGCSGCQRFDKCNRCIPGFQLFEEPKFQKVHRVEKRLINHCNIGCQPGFYLRGFNGTCGECDANCEECIDSVFTLKEEFVRGSSPPSYCLKCASSGDTKMFINLTNGKCVESCGDPGYQSEEAVPHLNKRALYCFKCRERCQKCNVSKISQCLKCKSGYSLGDDDACLSFLERRDVRVGLVFTTFGILAFSVLVCSIWLIVMSTGDSQEVKKSMDVKGNDLDKLMRRKNIISMVSDFLLKIVLFLLIFVEGD